MWALFNLNFLTMEKYKYVAEFEINASPKMLFPYLSTASGLAEWFADSVSVNGDKVFHISWDGVNHPARMVTKRTNAHVRFQFLKEEEPDEDRASYLDFKVEFNEMTQTTFLKVTDYSEMDNEDDLRDMWQQLIDQLKEIIGA